MSNARDAFVDRFDFALDSFQISAMDALDAGRSVLVAAPTGAGKTIVGEYAIQRALAAGSKVFYTSPIKALSNQKYQELTDWLGHDSVGLITGDVSLNPHARVVVMTTEILRNMMYADSPDMSELGFVVMDEVHYLADRIRGPVWEEIIIHLPAHVRLVALSATVSNVEEFGAWVSEVRGHTEVIVSERRPIPLWQHVLHERELIDVFLDENGNPTPSHGPHAYRTYREINPALARLSHARGSLAHARRPARDRAGRRGYRDRRRREHEDSRHGQEQRPRAMSRADIVHILDLEGMLPAIFFIFSRSGCDLAVGNLMRANVSLTNSSERVKIREAFHEAFADMSDSDVEALQIPRIQRAAMHGIAAHHAGQLPAVKRVIEELFARGLIKVVFATETLALGINMPARTVVMDKLTKFNGTEHARITPGEYTQLTGRAGRRGIDLEGHAVVVVSDAESAREVAGLASTRTYTLRSAFRPTYNMSVNLLQRFTVEQSRETLESSFAQFHTDRSVVAQARRVRELSDTVQSYREALTCEAGDIHEYARLLDAVSSREKALSKDRAAHERSRVLSHVARLRRGTVISLASGKRRGFAVVIHQEQTLRGPKISVVYESGELRDIYAADLAHAPTVIDEMRVAGRDRFKSPRVRKDTAAALRERLRGQVPARTSPAATARATRSVNDDELMRVRAELKAHPCHACPERDQHLRWISRYRKEVRERDRAERQVMQRTSYLGRQFDRVREVLENLGYIGPLQPDGRCEVQPKGQLLQRIYSERDLLVCEGIDSGVLAGMRPATLAAVASALSFEPRREEASGHEAIDQAFGRAMHALSILADDINRVEKAAGLDETPAPHAGSAGAVYRWAMQESFAAAIADHPWAPGDFVRHVRQVIDLLDHIAHVPGRDHQQLAATALKARALLLRDIVAQDF